MPIHLLRMVRPVRLACTMAILAFLVACEPPQTDTPRPTAATILQITPAPTQNIDATATLYASRLVPTPTPAGLYTVQTGDTLGSLAEEFSTTVEELMAANGLTDPNAIQAGERLIIPSLISSTLDLNSTAAGTPVTNTLALTPEATQSTP